MLHPVCARLALSIAAPALAVASLHVGDSPESTTDVARGPLTCQEGFCQGSTGSDDTFWPWLMLFPTGSGQAYVTSAEAL
ncbi:hypothetical protein [Nocardia sp. NPDC046763]|uniref:hypothetical protein n=1 Tax=Nocardia sp. NPDC046763 TaxID=3155256 RepID=UPI0033CDCD75